MNEKLYREVLATNPGRNVLKPADKPTIIIAAAIALAVATILTIREARSVINDGLVCQALAQKKSPKRTLRYRSFARQFPPGESVRSIMNDCLNHGVKLTRGDVKEGIRKGVREGITFNNGLLHDLIAEANN